MNDVLHIPQITYPSSSSSKLTFSGFKTNLVFKVLGICSGFFFFLLSIHISSFFIIFVCNSCPGLVWFGLFFKVHWHVNFWLFISCFIFNITRYQDNIITPLSFSCPGLVYILLKNLPFELLGICPDGFISSVFFCVFVTFVQVWSHSFSKGFLVSNMLLRYDKVKLMSFLVKPYIPSFTLLTL